MNQGYSEHLKKIAKWALGLLGLIVFLLLLPQIYALTLHSTPKTAEKTVSTDFPVTVDPRNKQIVESEKVNAFLASPASPLQASAISTWDTFLSIFKTIATAISDLPLYQNLSFVGSNRIVTIPPGLRKEQVATSFAKALKWNNKQKLAFQTKTASSTLPLAEGSFAAGTYAVKVGMTPRDVQDLVNKQFIEDIQSHYSTTTAEVVPLNVALTVASLIQRETIGTEDMRIVSGIIWNRVFLNMNLQLDATLQYVKANKSGSSVWWPVVNPPDKYIKSPYNTYMHPGLPPTPIASPSVAAVLAALNPIKTSCIFYFHDNKGDFHCSDNYAGHVALLKKYFGRGK